MQRNYQKWLDKVIGTPPRHPEIAEGEAQDLDADPSAGAECQHDDGIDALWRMFAKIDIAGTLLANGSRVSDDHSRSTYYCERKRNGNG
jgi:hypothetical protein